MNPLSSKPINEEKHSSLPISKQTSPIEVKTDEISKKNRRSRRRSSSGQTIKNANQSQKNPKMEKVAYKELIQKYQESANEPDISDERIDLISKALDQFILPMDEDSLFYDTDLIVIDESFKEKLPLNGISPSELHQIEELFKSICDGKEKFKIITTYANDPFKKETENLIKKLLTRNIGRKLIHSVIENNYVNRIDIVTGTKSFLSETEFDGSIQITIGNTPAHYIAYDPSGKLKTEFYPFYIQFAHELIHASHLPNSHENDLPTFSHRYANMEEQWTITGLKKDFTLETARAYVNQKYNELNEWNIAAAFTNIQNIYYPRFSHNAVNFNPLSITASEIHRLKLCGQLEEVQQKNQKEVLRSIIQKGVLIDLEEIDQKTPLLLSTLFENEPIPIIFSGVLSGNIQMIKFLESKGFDLNVTVGHINAIECLFQNIKTRDLMEYYDVIRFLIKKHVSISHALNKLITIADLKILKKDKYRPLMKLLFSYYAKNHDLSVFFLTQIAKSTTDTQTLGDLILEYSTETLKEFLAAGHSLKESIIYHNRVAETQTTFSKFGFNTTELDNSLTDLRNHITSHI